MPTGKKAIIIGCGIGGASAALFLNRAGYAVEIFEANLPHHPAGGGLALAPNGMHVLAELGLSEKIITQGHPIRNAVFKNAKGKRLARMAMSDSKKYRYPAVAVQRQLLTDTLIDALNRHNIAVHYRKRLLNIEQNENGVTAFFEDGTTAAGDLLIGADGINSKTRSFVSPETVPAFTGIIARGGFIAKNKLPGLGESDLKDMHFVYGRQGFFGYGAANENELMWWTNVAADKPWPREKLVNFDIAEEQHILLEQYGTYDYPVPDIIKRADRFLRINVFDIAFLPRWHNGKVVLMGDAAHAVSPNSGQGASMALEDALLLAKKIRDCPDLATAFGEFETERRPRVERIILEGRRRGQDKTVVNASQQFIRELMMRIFINLFGNKGNEWLYAYKTDWR